MITNLTIGALTLLTGLQATDTTVAARGVNVLELENVGGSVVVRTWDRDEVRIQADHSRRTEIEIDVGNGVISIEPEGTMGPATMVDFQLTIPVSMSIDIEGMYTDVDAQGLGGEVSVETLEGMITIRGGVGDISVEAVNGEIRIMGARGRIEASSVSQGVWITDSSGEIMAESVSGSIHLRGIDSDRVDAGTVSGRITYEGAIVDGGSYYFGAHSGQIVLALPDGVNARVSATSLTGDFVGRYPGTPESIDARRRDAFTLGSGSAEIEIETFSGGIVIRRQGDPETEEELAWRESGHSGWGQSMGRDAGMHAAMGAAIASEVVGNMEWLGPVIDGSVQMGLDAAEWSLNMPALMDLEDLEDLDLRMEELNIHLEGLESLEGLGERINRSLERTKHRRKH